MRSHCDHHVAAGNDVVGSVPIQVSAVGFGLLLVALMIVPSAKTPATEVLRLAAACR